MNETRDREDKSLFDGLQPMQLPSDLRSRVVPAARARMTDEVVPDLWSRIWNHRGIRLAWASAVVLLLAGNAYVAQREGSVGNRPDRFANAENRPDEQLSNMLRPVRIAADVQPIVGLFAAGGNPIDLDMRGNSS
jgi:hypothetical protein